MSYERDFQRVFISTLKDEFPECIVLKNDPTYIQGIPDLIILFQDKWAALECKRDTRSKRRPNQEYYIQHLDNMGFARFVSPQNAHLVIDELRSYFGKELFL